MEKEFSLAKTRIVKFKSEKVESLIFCSFQPFMILKRVEPSGEKGVQKVGLNVIVLATKLQDISIESYADSINLRIPLKLR